MTIPRSSVAGDRDGRRLQGRTAGDRRRGFLLLQSGVDRFVFGFALLAFGVVLGVGSELHGLDERARFAAGGLGVVGVVASGTLLATQTILAAVAAAVVLLIGLGLFVLPRGR